MPFPNIFPRDEEINEFLHNDSLKILNFILMAYIKFFKTEYIDLLGVELGPSGQYDRLVVYSYSEKKNFFEKSTISQENETIHFAQAYDFDLSGELSFLIVFRDRGGRFKYKVMKNGKVIHRADNLFSIPFLFSHPDTGHLLILTYDGAANHVYRIKDGKVEELNEKIPYVDLTQMHSSAYVDVTGDLKSECVFVAGGSDYARIKIYANFLENHCRKIWEAPYPQEASAILFGDLKAVGHLDLFYIEKRAGHYFLIIYFHTGNKSSPYDQSTEINLSQKLNLNQNDEIIFTCDELNGLRAGPSISYVDKSQFPNICIPVRNANMTTMRTIKYEFKEEVHVLTEVHYKINSVANALSFSFADVQNQQDDFLIINHKTDSSYNLSFYEKRFGKTKNFMKCTASYAKGNRLNNMAIPGINYRFEIHADGMTIKSVQIPQTCFLHLGCPYSLVGLNVISILVDHLAVGSFPLYDSKVYEIASKSVPNSFLAFNFDLQKQTIRLNLYLRLDYMKHLLILVFACILIINITIVVILRYRENKKIKEMNFQRDRGNIYVAF